MLCTDSIYLLVRTTFLCSRVYTSSLRLRCVACRISIQAAKISIRKSEIHDHIFGSPQRAFFVSVLSTYSLKGLWAENGKEAETECQIPRLNKETTRLVMFYAMPCRAVSFSFDQFKLGDRVHW